MCHSVLPFQGRIVLYVEATVAYSFTPSECLDGFYFFFMSNAAGNVGVHISLPAFRSFREIHRNGITGWYGSSIVTFLGTFILFTIAAVPIYTPTKCAQVSNFSISLSTLITLFLLCHIFCIWY